MNYILQPQDSEIVFYRKGKKRKAFNPKINQSTCQKTTKNIPRLTEVV